MGLSHQVGSSLDCVNGQNRLGEKCNSVPLKRFYGLSEYFMKSPRGDRDPFTD